MIFLAADFVLKTQSKKSEKEEISSDEEEHVPRKVVLKKKRQKEKQDEIKEQSNVPRASDDVWGQKKEITSMLEITISKYVDKNRTS